MLKASLDVNGSGTLETVGRELLYAYCATMTYLALMAVVLSA